MELGPERSGDRAWGRTKRSAARGGGAWGGTEAAAQVRSSGRSGRVGALEEEGDENERKCRKKKKKRLPTSGVLGGIFVFTVLFMDSVLREQIWDCKNAFWWPVSTFNCRKFKWSARDALIV